MNRNPNRLQPIRLAGKPVASITGMPDGTASDPFARETTRVQLPGLTADEKVLLRARQAGVTRSAAPAVLGWTIDRVYRVWKSLGAKLRAAGPTAVHAGGSSRHPFYPERIGGKKTWSLSVLDATFIDVMSKERLQITETKAVPIVLEKSSPKLPQVRNLGLNYRETKNPMKQIQLSDDLKTFDYRQHPDLVRFQSERDRISREAKQIAAELSDAEVELASATTAAEEAECDAIVDPGKAKDASTARKTVERLTTKITELRTRASRYPKVQETITRMAVAKERELSKTAAVEIRSRYERAVSMLANALEAAAEANAELMELEYLAGMLFGVQMKTPIHHLSWDSLNAADKNSFINEWLLEVAHHHAGSLPENHPARIRYQQKEVKFQRHEQALRDRPRLEQEAIERRLAESRAERDARKATWGY